MVSLHVCLNSFPGQAFRLAFFEAVGHAAQLTSDIEDADAMVAQITAFVTESEEIRKIGKKENKLAIEDAEDAQTAVADAVAVMKSNAH